MVRNGYHQSREVLTSAGAVQVTVARVNDLPWSARATFINGKIVERPGEEAQPEDA